VKPLQKVAVAFILGISFASACPVNFGQTADQPSKQPAKHRPRPPLIMHAVAPQYTKQARKERIQGISVISLTVGIDGLPHDVTVFRSLAENQLPNLRLIAEGLDEQAIMAVEQYRFKPATLDGKSIPVRVNIEVNF
jgi:protein TonB